MTNRENPSTIPPESSPVLNEKGGATIAVTNTPPSHTQTVMASLKFKIYTEGFAEADSKLANVTKCHEKIASFRKEFQGPPQPLSIL